MLAARDEKGGVAIDARCKNVAPSDNLRKWFSRDPARDRGGGNVERCYPSMDAIF